MFKRIKKSIDEMGNIFMMSVWCIIFIAIFILIGKLSPHLFNIEKGDAFALAAIIMLLTIVPTIAIYKRYLLMGISSSKDNINDRYIKLELENKDLKKTNCELSNQIDTMLQTQQLVPQYKSARQLQVLTVSKSGHIVKEEELFPLKNLNVFEENFPKNKKLKFFNTELEEDDKWRVFFSDNKVYRYGVGIKLEEIRCAIDTKSDILYLKNVKLSRLNRLEDDYDGYIPEKDMTNHVWIIKKEKNGDFSIINDQQHNDFKRKYKAYQQDYAGQSIQNEIDNLCDFYTEGLQRILSSRYTDKFRFIGENENIGGVTWLSLSEGMKRHSHILTAFMNDLYLAFDAMELCADKNRDLDNALASGRHINQTQKFIS